MAALLDVNRDFYDPLWAGSRVVATERFNTWPLVQSLLASSRARAEIGPGLCPRLPLGGTSFLDMSAPAVAKLIARGADAQVGLATDLPWADAAFDLVAAFDLLEHVDDDDRVLAELTRVSTPGAVLLLSAPLHPSRWTPFDTLVGHGRRYEPGALLSMLARAGWSVQSSAAYGMQPASPRVLDFVVWSFANRRASAIWWYAHAILPLGVLLQDRLDVQPGLIDLARVDEALFVCRRA
jgi:SAM-dependent methyltransferase